MEELDIRHLLDGIVVVSNRFGCFTQRESLCVYREGVKLGDLRSTDFRGVDFGVERRKAGEPKLKEHRKAILGKQSTYTVTLVSIQTTNCKALEKALKSANWLEKGSLVPNDNLEAVGNKFIQDILKYPGNRAGKVFVVYSELGQSCDWFNVNVELGKFDTKKIGVATYLHYARDFMKDGYACFFKAKDVERSFHGRINQQFPACLQKGLGNFYIDWKRFMHHTTKGRFCLVKLYSEPFKHFHNEALFGRPEIALKLLDPFEFSKYFANNFKPGYVAQLREFKRLLANVNRVRQEIESFGTTKFSFRARCEIILKVWLDTLENPSCKVLEGIDEDATWNSKSVCKLIDHSICAAQLRENLENAYYPVLNAMEKHLKNRISMIENSTPFVFGPRKFTIIESVFFVLVLL